MDYRELKAKHSDVQLSMQYGPTSETATTVVCFYNFYSQIFRERAPVVDLHVFVFDEDGHQVDHLIREVPPFGHAQVQLPAYPKRREGLVGVMAVPRANVHELNVENKNLQKHFGSGFYVVWKNQKGHVDTMHEWKNWQTQLPVLENFYFALMVDPRLRTGFILMNPTEVEVPSPHVEIYRPPRVPMGKIDLSPMKPMSTRLLLLEELFPEVIAAAKSDESFGVKIRASLVCPPLTAELHTSGDFHFHHIS